MSLISFRITFFHEIGTDTYIVLRYTWSVAECSDVAIFSVRLVICGRDQ